MLFISFYQLEITDYLRKTTTLYAVALHLGLCLGYSQKTYLRLFLIRKKCILTLYEKWNLA